MVLTTRTSLLQLAGNPTCLGIKQRRGRGESPHQNLPLYSLDGVAVDGPAKQLYLHQTR